MVLVMIPKGKTLDHVWDDLLDWAKRRKADRARLQQEKDKEFHRRVVLGADALVCADVRAFFRGVAWAIGILESRRREPGTLNRAHAAASTGGCDDHVDGNPMNQPPFGSASST